MVPNPQLLQAPPPAIRLPPGVRDPISPLFLCTLAPSGTGLSKLSSHHDRIGLYHSKPISKLGSILPTLYDERNPDLGRVTEEIQDPTCTDHHTLPIDPVW
jgi:hypothetical protein